MADPLVMVLVLNWNGGDALVACVESVRKQTHPRVRLLVLDNGSTDGSLDRVIERFPDVEVLRNGANLGYCDGNNRGLERALRDRADFVLLLNNDATLEPDAVSAMVRAIDADGAPPAGIVGPKILWSRRGPDEPLRIWSAGGEDRVRQNVGELRGNGEIDRGQFDRMEEVGFVPGCALLVRREVLEKVGLLDPDYFAYLEDMDLCRRARDAGFRVRYAPEARVVHDASRSTGGGYTPGRKYLMGLNSIRYLRKYGTPGQWLAFSVLGIAGLAPALVVESVRGNARVVCAKAKGIWHGLLGRRAEPGMIPR
ncbi:MAG: glycosyltransferase family 2 protein [Planctomycetes bacterium]|nr:glycosyltransferase family 2 protein [Planctomycetota bacterium]MBI3847687.1 glycosyltransferase family 2 protein [Planctomycetota bacterium]